LTRETTPVSMQSQQRGPGVRRWLATGDAPLVVLGLGLAIVALVVVAERPMTPGRLREFTAFLGPKSVGTVGPFNLPPVSPFDAQLPRRPWPLTLMFAAVYLSSTTAIGSRVAAAIQGNDRWPAPVRMLAGFLPGYVMTMAPLQLLFARVPYRDASWVAMAALPSAALFLHRRALLATLLDLRAGRAARLRGAWAIAVALALVVVAVVHRLQQGIYFLTQDSITYQLNGGLALLSGAYGQYLIHWNVQTDEWLYNAPLMFIDGGSAGDLWFPFHITESVSVAASLCLLYGIVHRVARRRKALAAGVAVAATFGSTLAIYPWLYVLVIFGGQPFLGLAHPGRHVSILAPWVAVLLLERPRKVGAPTIGLLTLGLCFVTLNAVLYVGLAVAAALLWRGVRGRRARLQERWVRLAVHATLLLAMGLPVIAFAFTRGRPTSATFPGLLLVLTILIALIGACLICWGTPKEGVPRVGRGQVGWFVAWLGTVALGLVFSDNLSTSGVGSWFHKLLAPLLPGFGDPVARRPEVANGMLVGFKFPSFSQQTCDASVSCGGVPHFLVAYGVLFVLVLAAWSGYGRLRPDASRTNQRRVVILLGLAGLAVGQIMVFFVGLPTFLAVIWSRVIELPYYTLLVLGVLGFCESKSRRVTIVGVGFLVIWTIAPLIGTGWPQQMTRNAGWYLDQLGVL
jgi:hypothetical protein